MIGSEYEGWFCDLYGKWELSLSEIIESGNIQKFKRNPIVDQVCCNGSLKNVPFFDMLFEKYQGTPSFPWNEIEAIDKFGEPYPDVIKIDGVDYQISGVSARYLVIADEILDEIQSHYQVIPQGQPVKILEIGGGFGGLCAMINVLAISRGMKISEYGIFDLPAAQKFQSEYLRNVLCNGFNFNAFAMGSIVAHCEPLTSQNETPPPNVGNFEITHLSNPASFNENYDFAISCYALGEFTAELKSVYIEHVLSKVPHGYILWNAQGSSNGVDIANEVDITGEALLKKYLPKLTISDSPILAPETLKHIIY